MVKKQKKQNKTKLQSSEGNVLEIAEKDDSTVFCRYCGDPIDPVEFVAAPLVPRPRIFHAECLNIRHLHDILFYDMIEEDERKNYGLRWRWASVSQSAEEPASKAAE